MTACRNVGSDRSKGRSSYGSFSEETSEIFSLRSRITRSPYWQERNLYTRINRLRLRHFPKCERLSVSHGGFRCGLCGNRGRLLHNRLLRLRHRFLRCRCLLRRLCRLWEPGPSSSPPFSSLPLPSSSPLPVPASPLLSSQWFSSGPVPLSWLLL